VVTNHDRSRFTERLDSLTTPGYLDGPGAREAVGLPPGTGPYRVITELAILGYHPETCRMEVLSLHPGVTADRVRQRTGFALAIPDPTPVTPPPTAAELAILRERIDPYRYTIGRVPRDTSAGRAVE
jgi:glutaconate CoA-transferase, subunit B